MVTRADEVAAYNDQFVWLLRDRPWIRRVQVILERDACPVCQVYDRSIASSELPVLPHHGCLKPRGCACWYAAVITEG